MLRAVLLGVLAVGSLTACSKRKGDAGSVAVGTAAGKVIEISGKVTATREGKSRELAQGGEIFRDDQIATSADGSVTIELFHNGAHWSVIANKQARVDTSLAWGLDKQAASKTVEHNSAAAGRNAERSAADTSSTAREETGEKEAGDKAAPAAAPLAQPMTESMPAPAPGSTTKGAPANTGAARGDAPPPPPKPAVGVADIGVGGGAPPEKTRAKADKNLADESGGGPKEAPRAPQTESMKVVISPQELANHHKDDFKACLDPKHPKVTISITITKGKPSVALVGENSAKVKACANDVAKKIEWMPGVSSKVSLTFE